MTDKRELLIKLLELAAKGVGGEAENAKKMAEAIAKKYNVDMNEYTKIAVPKFNAAKRSIMNVASCMCGCLFFKNGYHWYLLGKHSQLALDCYYYLCSLLPKEHRKDSTFLHGFAGGLMERLQQEPGWVDNMTEIDLIKESIGGCETKTRSYRGSQAGYDHSKKVSLHRQAESKTRLLTSK